MKKTKSTDFKNILVYLAMVLLVLVVALPPVFRLVFKGVGTEKEENNVKPNQGQAVALICKKQVGVGTMSYNITVTSNYLNGNLNKVTLNYVQNGEAAPTVTEDPVQAEIASLRTSPAVTETANDTSVKFVINQEAFQQNSDDVISGAYFQELGTQEANLRNLGYACQQMTS